MSLPILVSLPHAGARIPAEVEAYNRLSPEEVREDSDQWADAIYKPLGRAARHFVAAEIARAFVDVNRTEDDFSRDGVVKTHTCWNKEIYIAPLPLALKQELINKYYHPYHRQLTACAEKDVRLGLDCHTMADKAPPIEKTAGQTRPDVCLSNAHSTCPQEWLLSLKKQFEKYFDRVEISNPFQGGYIIRRHSQELPWIQIEIKRGEGNRAEQKSEWVLEAVERLCKVL